MLFCFTFVGKMSYRAASCLTLVFEILRILTDADKLLTVKAADAKFVTIVLVTLNSLATTVYSKVCSHVECSSLGCKIMIVISALVVKVKGCHLIMHIHKHIHDIKKIWLCSCEKQMIYNFQRCWKQNSIGQAQN